MIAIYNTEGDLQCKYNYDAWGNHRIGNARNELIYDSATGVIAAGYESHIAILNPIRYRGYYYDNETGLYYLQSRYYDATLCRFLNRDNVNYLEPESIHGLNLYAYCNNNPVMFADPSGHFAMPNWLKWLIGGVVIAGLGIATVFTGGAAGVILGAAFYGAVTGSVGGAIVGGVIGGVASAISGEGFWSGFANGAADGFMSGAIMGGMTGALTAGINIATGAVKIVGTAQKTGTFFHGMASNIQAGKMAMQIGKYSQITLDRSLNRAGLVGRKMPDVIGTARWGKSLAVEVVSKSQTAVQMMNKLKAIQLYNPNLSIRVISWAGWLGRWLF